MPHTTRTLPGLALLCALAAAPAAAQNVTTGAITGVVMDAQKGVLPGATVTAVHTPTGTSYEAVTQSDGRFDMLSVKVGGPYTVAVTMPGFRRQEQTGIQVALGESRAVDFTLALETVQETVNVVADVQLIDTSRAGAAANVETQAIETLPTISRDIADIVRTKPLFNSMGGSAGDGASVVSVAGASYRYNNLQIDGAQNNDLFGLASSAGKPGGTAETQPISLDAIGEMQLVVSPYDVRQGGFAGGGINLITKSGTNTLRGSAFFYGRDQRWVGKLDPTYAKAIPSASVSTFNDKQAGGSIGGPIVRNRAFYFGTLDYGRKERPAGFSVNGTGQNFGNEALVDRFLSALKNLYGYEPGPNPKSEFIKGTDNNKYFVRADFNLAKNHQLTVRTNYITAHNDVGGSSLTQYRMPDAYYRYVSNTSSTVAQLNSTLGKGVNELRVTYTRVRDHREHAFDQPNFPQVTVTIAPSTNVVAGTEQFSARNAIDQDIVELNEAYTTVRGTHQITLGTHNEFLKLKNLFIRDNFGTYSFASLDMFEQGFSQSYDRSFSATSDPMQAAKFSVRQWGVYAGDQWRVKPRFTLTYGFRMDAPRYPSKPTANPLAVSTFGYATDVVPNDIQWSPRVGVNWDLRGDGREQVRGGVGMFTGRPAYVWISNQFGNTGIDFSRIGASFNTNNRIPFYKDPLGQPMTVTGATAGSFTNEIDLIDPDFKYPSILRGNVAWDRKLPWGLASTVEYVWSSTLQDIAYQNLNFAMLSGVKGVGGREFFGRVVSSLSDVIFLQNTDQGYTWNLSVELRRPMRNRYTFSGSYSYGVARSIMDGTSDQAASNWGNVYHPGNPNAVPLARSNFDPGHRVAVSGSYEFRLPAGMRATVSAFYSGQSGRPYALTTNRDTNGDNRGTNDLLYIPASATELTFTGGTYQDFMNFINGEPCLTQFIGTIMPRNGCRAPWINTFDGRLTLGLPFKKVRTDITADVLNLFNLVDQNSGLIRYMSFGQLTQFQPVPTSVTATNPLTGYNIAAIMAPTFSRYLYDNLRSRWQLQLGVRVRF